MIKHNLPPGDYVGISKAGTTVAVVITGAIITWSLWKSMFITETQRATPSSIKYQKYHLCESDGGIVRVADLKW